MSDAGDGAEAPAMDEDAAEEEEEPEEGAPEEEEYDEEVEAAPEGAEEAAEEQEEEEESGAAVAEEEEDAPAAAALAEPFLPPPLPRVSSAGPERVRVVLRIRPLLRREYGYPLAAERQGETKCGTARACSGGVAPQLRARPRRGAPLCPRPRRRGARCAAARRLLPLGRCVGAAMRRQRALRSAADAPPRVSPPRLRLFSPKNEVHTGADAVLDETSTQEDVRAPRRRARRRACLRLAPALTWCRLRPLARPSLARRCLRRWLTWCAAPSRAATAPSSRTARPAPAKPTPCSVRAPRTLRRALPQFVRLVRSPKPRLACASLPRRRARARAQGARRRPRLRAGRRATR
jgi:hypothetical protein